MLTIFSIIPSLKNESGHFFEYNLALSKASLINNFKHIKIIPKTALIPIKDETWEKVIYEIENIKKLKNFKNIFPFIKVFKRLKKEKNAALFLEDFNLMILILILIASIIVRPKCQICLFHRYEYTMTFLKGRAYKIIHFLLEKIFNKKRVKYLTDSEILKNYNGIFFNRKYFVFPIPHVCFSTEKKVLDKNFKYFWWPGGLIREEKGLNNIQSLAKSLTTSSNIKIMLAKAAKNFVNNENIFFIPTNLTRKEYESYMASSDLVLLPYISNLYRYRTSGIFVEAIIAGSIPVVTKDTWMSYELNKYNLNELIIDWSSKDVIKQLDSISKNKNILNKFCIMRESYKEIHSIKNYALILKALFEQNSNFDKKTMFYQNNYN